MLPLVIGAMLRKETFVYTWTCLTDRNDRCVRLGKRTSRLTRDNAQGEIYRLENGCAPLTLSFIGIAVINTFNSR